MTKAEAEDLIRKRSEFADKNISNSYTLTEDSVGNNKNIFLDPAMVKGVKITLKEANSWQKNSNGDWPDKLVEHPTQYSKAYMTTITNKYKRQRSWWRRSLAALLTVRLMEMQHWMVRYSSCIPIRHVHRKQKVFDAAGNKNCRCLSNWGGGKLTTDYLRSGNTYYLKEIQAPTGFP